MVIWTDKAVFNIQEFIQNAREDTENTVRNYMNKLVDYVESLDNMMQMGKKYEAPFTNTDKNLKLLKILNCGKVSCTYRTRRDLQKSRLFL